MGAASVGRLGPLDSSEILKGSDRMAAGIPPSVGYPQVTESGEAEAGVICDSWPERPDNNTTIFLRWAVGLDAHLIGSYARLGSRDR